MKFLLSIFLFVSAMVALSQTGNVIVEENRIWSTVEIHCLPNGNNYSTYFIKLEEDTVIDGLQYKRMLHCNEKSQTNWTLYGFMREDENHRVYLRPPDYFEGMVYDFGCAVGDSLITWNIYLNNDSLHYVVTEIDSVLLLDGYKKRIKLFEYNNQLEEVWVEGIGSYYGVLNSGTNAYGGICGGYESLCYENQGTLIYQNPGYNTCYYDVSVDIDQKFIEPVSVYPNPASDNVNIDFADNEKKELVLSDINGKIFYKKFVSESKVLLNLQDLDKGYYFIRIISDSFSYPSFKLIVD